MCLAPYRSARLFIICMLVVRFGSLLPSCRCASIMRAKHAAIGYKVVCTLLVHMVLEELHFHM